MLKKTITYKDYNGIERTEDFYFNLTQTELMKWDLKTPGGLAAKLEKITQKFDVPSLTEFLEDLIDKSYGIKSEDGVRFIKDPDLRCFARLKHMISFSLSSFQTKRRLQTLLTAFFLRNFLKKLKNRMQTFLSPLFLINCENKEVLKCLN